jgi:hypothetical protein
MDEDHIAGGVNTKVLRGALKAVADAVSGQMDIVKEGCA